MNKKRRIIIGITGATGIQYGQRLLDVLHTRPDIETHLILTNPALQTLAYETDWKAEDLKSLADEVHSNKNIGASIASGSFQTDGMVIVPCSVNTLACVANGISDTLITRAADVMLKERRRLVMVFRETPLHQGHLQNMLQVTQMGGIIAPPLPAFYQRPQSIDDIIDQTVSRILDLLNIDNELAPRWQEPPQ